MSAVAIERGAALKEWAAVVKALEAGTQILILRKGGIREEGFSAEAPAFFLYPTGFHQTPEKLQPQHRHFMDEAMTDRPPENIARIRSLGQVVEELTISDAGKLDALKDEYIYTPEEMNKRYDFRPGENLTALAVRVYRLKAAVEIPVKTKYGGCVSWIRLEDPLSTEGATPVLSDAAFQQRRKLVRSIL